MLNIDRDPVFTTTVTVQLPGNQPETFKARFRVLPIDAAENLATAAGAHDFLVRAIDSLDDIEDDDGKALPYSEDLRERLLAMPDVRGALAAAYFRGVEEAARGNSDGPAGRG
jgi:hypothetical protein